MEHDDFYPSYNHDKLLHMKTNHLQRDSAKVELVNAMKELMKHETVENITVSAICQQADLSRQTFYRCFYDKYDQLAV